MQLFNKSLGWLIAAINIITIAGCSSNTTVTSTTESGVIFGNTQGLVYENNTLLTGNAPIATLDDGGITALTLDKNGTLYASTNATNGGHVWQYDQTSMLWTMLPNNLNSYLSPDGTTVNSLIVDTSNNVYAATANGNVFVYTSNTWQQLGTTALDGSAINALAIDSSNIIYAGTQNGNVFEYSAQAWQQVGTQSDGSSIMTLAINSNNIIYVGTQNGNVFEYLNGSWVQLNNCGSQVNFLVIDTNNIIYAGTENGTVWKSGTPWVNLGNPDATPVNSLALDSSNNLYAGTLGALNGESSGQVYRYASNAWNQVSNLNFTYNNTAGLFNTAGIQDIVINSNGTIYAGTNYPSNNYNNGGGLVFANSNASESWQIIGSGSIDGTEVITVAVDKTGNYYAGTDIGIYKYSNGSWTTLILPIAEIETNGPPQFYTIAVDNNGNVYGGAYFAGQIYEYVNQTGSVIALPETPYTDPGVNGNVYQLAVDNNNNLYMAYANPMSNITSPYVFKYTPSPGGGSGIYESVGTNGPNESSNTDGVNGIVINSSNDIFVASGYFVWKYPHNESSWVLMGTLGNTADGSVINSLAIDQQNNLYAAITNNNIPNGNVFKYTNESDSWALIGTTFANGALTVTTDSNNNIYVASPPNNNGYPSTIFMYSNGGFIAFYSGNYAELYNNNSNAAGI